jgi:hypothetical protein
MSERKAPEFKVKFVKLKGDVIGAHPLGSKIVGFKVPRNTFLIEKSLSSRERKRVLVHEKIEYKLMKKGMPYEKAHPITKNLEKGWIQLMKLVKRRGR